uniref:DUF1127 domain-containing protein n=1 Tax=Pseudomonas lini TaxID=163011 RepID=UPI003F5824E2
MFRSSYLKRSPAWPRLRGLPRALTDSLERARTRRLLGQLNDQQLSDLGISMPTASTK